MIDLLDYQFELLESAEEDAEGLHMGRHTPVNVRTFDVGSPETRDADAERPMADGIAFGRDFRSGRLISLELNALSYTPALARAPYGDSAGAEPVVEALNWADQVESAWAADRIRLVPGAVQVLRWRVGNRVRRVYGRTRRCSPTTGNVHTGNVPMVADFQTIDDLYYSDQRKVTTVDIVPAANAWTVWPLEWPVYWYRANESANAGTITVGGTRATWPVFTIYGPNSGTLASPSIVIGGYGELKLNTTLAYDQVIYLDTRPWNRGIRRNDGANLAGALDTRSTPLSMLRIPPGTYEFALKGTDASGTSQLVVEHRDAFSSF